MSLQQMQQNLCNPYALVFTVPLSFGFLLAIQNWVGLTAFVSSLLFSAFVIWLNPARKQEVQREEFDSLKEQCHALREQLTSFKMKLGFQRG